MFQFPSFTRLPYEFRQAWHGLPMPGFPIRTSTDQSLLAAPRGFSQLATSFFASWHLGIRHAPLLPRLSQLKLIPRELNCNYANPNSRFFCKNASLPLLSCQRPNFGGDGRNRTADFLLAKQALSQLSHAPTHLLPCL